MKNPDRTHRTTGALNQKPHADSIGPARKTGASCPSEITLVSIKSEPRIDSRLLAQHLGVQHETATALLRKYRDDFEQFGILRFQTGEIDGRGQPQKFALLNEDQCYLLLAYSRNTTKVRQLKVRLVKSFAEARRAAEQRGAEYLPTYHALHDEIKTLAAGSSNERFVHLNINRLLNRFVGIESGQRRSASLPVQSLLVVGQAVAERAMRGAADHHEGYHTNPHSLI